MRFLLNFLAEICFRVLRKYSTLYFLFLHKKNIVRLAIKARVVFFENRVFFLCIQVNTNSVFERRSI